MTKMKYSRTLFKCDSAARTDTNDYWGSATNSTNYQFWLTETRRRFRLIPDRQQRQWPTGYTVNRIGGQTTYVPSAKWTLRECWEKQQLNRKSVWLEIIKKNVKHKHYKRHSSHTETRLSLFYGLWTWIVWSPES